MNMDKFLAGFLIVGVMLMIGIKVGQWTIERQITQTYEDGSFIGCYEDGLCHD
jgi:hypothetical protein